MFEIRGKPNSLFLKEPVIKCLMMHDNLTTFKLEPTTPNISQHLAKGWPNMSNMVRTTILGYLGLKYYNRLAGALYRYVD